MRNEYLISGHPTIQDSSHVPEEFDDPLDHKALAFLYNEETYTSWLDNQDDFTECNQMMEERYRMYEHSYMIFSLTAMLQKGGMKGCK